MELLKKNQIIRANIEGYNSEGSGIARYNGMVIFVQGAVDGESCDIRIMKAGKNVAYGKIETLLLPSPCRIKPECRLKSCGGCDLRHVSYEEELRFKHQRVADAMTRIANLQLPVAEVLGGGDTQRYRNKAIFNVGKKK